MTFNKTQLALSIAAATFSLAIVVPQAQADSSSAAEQAAQKTKALEAQMQQMSSMMQSMQEELNRVKASAEKATVTTAKVQELDQWAASVKSTPEAVSAKDNLVAVRGGWEVLDRGRGDLLANGALVNNGNPQGFYFGGAFDYNVNNDLFGLMDDTSFMVELGVEYSQFGSGANTVSGCGATGGLLGLCGANKYGIATDSRLRINASPKIKFNHGGKLRPWLIPVGMEINILGVPSNAVSVLNSGMQFGGGAEYDLFRGIVLGADVRYHYATSTTDGVNTNGVSTGGYVGFKF